MKRIFFITLLVGLAVWLFPASLSAQQPESTRKERNYITEGNKLYNDGRYRAAIQKYQEALKINPTSAVARYNPPTTAAARRSAAASDLEEGGKSLWLRICSL